MAKFSKEVLRPGVFRKGAERIQVTDEDLRIALLNFKKMQSDGYRVPVIIEHTDSSDDPEGLPVKATKTSDRDRAKYTAGWTDDMRINSSGSLEVDMDIRSKDGLKLIKEVNLLVSPQFGPWTHPGTDKPQPMTMTHFALTPYPVDIQQDPTYTEIGESQTVSATQLSQLVRFSMADMIPEKKPAAPEGEQKLGQDESEESEGSGILEQMPESQIVDPVVGQVLEMLKSHGVVLPEGTTFSGDLKVLLAGLMSAAHAKSQQQPAVDPSQQQQPGAPQNGQDPRLAGTRQENTITMSNATATAPAVDLKTLPEYIQMSQQNKALEGELSQLRREKYNSRVNSLLSTGRINQEQAAAFRTTIGTYQFSTADSSTDIVKLEDKLELAEEMPEGSCWSSEEKIKRFSMSEHKPGNFFNDTNPSELSAADADKFLDAAGFPKA